MLAGPSAANYSTYEGYETWAVFDAYGEAIPASQEVTTPYLSVHCTGYGQTADSYIERACASCATMLQVY